MAILYSNNIIIQTCHIFWGYCNRKSVSFKS